MSNANTPGNSGTAPLAPPQDVPTRGEAIAQKTTTTTSSSLKGASWPCSTLSAVVTLRGHKNQGKKMHVVAVVDTSVSMSRRVTGDKSETNLVGGGGATPSSTMTKLQQVDLAMKNLVTGTHLSNGDRLSVIVFNAVTEIKLEAKSMDMKGKAETIAALRLDEEKSIFHNVRSHTYFENAFRAAGDVIRKYPNLGCQINCVLLVTDGKPEGTGILANAAHTANKIHEAVNAAKESLFNLAPSGGGAGNINARNAQDNNNNNNNNGSSSPPAPTFLLVCGVGSEFEHSPFLAKLKAEIPGCETCAARASDISNIFLKFMNETRSLVAKDITWKINLNGGKLLGVPQTNLSTTGTISQNAEGSGSGSKLHQDEYVHQCADREVLEGDVWSLVFDIELDPAAESVTVVAKAVYTPIFLDNARRPSAGNQGDLRQKEVRVSMEITPAKAKLPTSGDLVRAAHIKTINLTMTLNNWLVLKSGVNREQLAITIDADEYIPALEKLEKQLAEQKGRREIVESLTGSTETREIDYYKFPIELGLVQNAIATAKECKALLDLDGEHAETWDVGSGGSAPAEYRAILAKYRPTSAQKKDLEDDSKNYKWKSDKTFEIGLWLC